MLWARKFIIGENVLAVASKFMYLGSVVTNNLSLEAKLNSPTGKASGILTTLSKKVWINNKLIDRVKVYHACIINVLLYGSESWTMNSIQKSTSEVSAYVDFVTFSEFAGRTKLPTLRSWNMPTS